MLCPACKVELKMSDREGIEIDYCPQCRGVWLDRGELDKIVEKSSSRALRAAATSTTMTIMVPKVLIATKMNISITSRRDTGRASWESCSISARQRVPFQGREMVSHTQPVA